MALPKISAPTYSVNLVSRGETKFRPFLVKEQKILMMAMESKDLDAVINAVKQIVNNCLVDDIDVDTLPMIDIELLFLNIRAKSMGENLELYYKCNNDQGLNVATGHMETVAKPCGMLMEVDVNVLAIEPLKLEDKKIALTPEVLVEMKYPTFRLVKLLQLAKTRHEAEMMLVAGCMDKVYTGGEVINATDATMEELMTWLEELMEVQYEKLEKWVKSAPQIRKTVFKQCTKCGKSHEIKLEGLADFFT